jgi:hypothetical protein
MQILRGCRWIVAFAAQHKDHLCWLGGLLLAIVVATTAWVLALMLAALALGMPTSARVLVGLALLVAAASVVAAATMSGDP